MNNKKTNIKKEEVFKIESVPKALAVMAHFRTIVENAKTLISYHYPQVNLAHIQSRDSYYTEIK